MEEKTSILGIQEIIARSKVQHPCFIVISGKSAGKMYKLTEELSVIGRGTDAQICVEEDGISRRHAQVVRRGEQLVIQDLGSTNGTFFNGEKKPEHVLEDGDKIQIGSTTILKFSYADHVEEEYQVNLYNSATRDAMTGCYNKKFFIDRLATEFAYAQRHKAELSLGMLDIDHFKKVNDTYGHPAGDAILKHFAGLVQQTIRTEDIFCRYGGEEFALILRQTPNPDAFTLAERIRQKLESNVCEHQGRPIPVTCSIGLATFSGGPNVPTAYDFLKAADELLYKAKQSGRNKTMIA